MKIVIYALMLILLSSFALATFSNTTVYNVSGTYNYTVPAGVTRINVSVWGAGGGGGGGGTGSGSIGGAGGGGAFSNGLLSVTPGETLFIMVGSGGAKGNFSTGTSGALTGDGAGGGAWTAVNRSTTPLIIAAGGGGGGGGDNADSAAGGAEALAARLWDLTERILARQQAEKARLSQAAGQVVFRALRTTEQTERRIKAETVEIQQAQAARVTASRKFKEAFRAVVVVV